MRQGCGKNEDEGGDSGNSKDIQRCRVRTREADRKLLPGENQLSKRRLSSKDRDRDRSGTDVPVDCEEVGAIARPRCKREDTADSSRGARKRSEALKPHAG